MKKNVIKIAVCALSMMMVAPLLAMQHQMEQSALGNVEKGAAERLFDAIAQENLGAIDEILAEGKVNVDEAKDRNDGRSPLFHALTDKLPRVNADIATRLVLDGNADINEMLGKSDVYAGESLLFWLLDLYSSSCVGINENKDIIRVINLFSTRGYDWNAERSLYKHYNGSYPAESKGFPHEKGPEYTNGFKTLEICLLLDKALKIDTKIADVLLTASKTTPTTLLRYLCSNRLLNFPSDYNLISYLFKKGANKRELFNHDVLCAAVKDGREGVVDFFLANGEKNIVRYKYGRNHDTLLHMAAAAGHKKVVELLLANGANANEPNEYGATPLHEAAFCGHTDILELLLENNKSGVNAKNNTQETPLHIAIGRGKKSQKEVAQLLLTKGANVNEPDENGDTPSFVAALKGHDDILKLLLENDQTGVYTKNRNKETPLHKAVTAGNKNVVELLLTKGANVNEPDKNGNTPLFVAVTNENYDILKLLLKRDRSGVDAKNKNEETPLNLLCRPIFDPDNQGRQRANEEAIKLLLTQGANVNEPDKNGDTPLFAAVINGHYDILKLFLENDQTGVYAKNENGDTLLHMAIKGKNNEKEKTPPYTPLKGRYDEAVELLLAYGALVNEPGGNGNTSLHAAVVYKDDHILELLLKNDRSGVNDPNNNGCTALHLAAELHGVGKEVLKPLLDNGANVNAQDENGQTPLHHAASRIDYGSDLVVKYLLERDANPNAKDKSKKLPLHLAYRAVRDHLRCVHERHMRICDRYDDPRERACVRSNLRDDENEEYSSVSKIQEILRPLTSFWK